jgi:hypothetical protein
MILNVYLIYSNNSLEYILPAYGQGRLLSERSLQYITVLCNAYYLCITVLCNAYYLCITVLCNAYYLCITVLFIVFFYLLTNFYDSIFQLVSSTVEYCYYEYNKFILILYGHNKFIDILPLD